MTSRFLIEMVSAFYSIVHTIEKRVYVARRFVTMKRKRASDSKTCAVNPIAYMVVCVYYLEPPVLRFFRCHAQQQ
jgi:hypothetical protein